jgi:hypothetical protein
MSGIFNRRDRRELTERLRGEPSVGAIEDAGSSRQEPTASGLLWLVIFVAGNLLLVLSHGVVIGTLGIATMIVAVVALVRRRFR